MCLCLCVQVGVLAEWVNPFYLDVGVGIQIREQFEEESQVKLDDFLLVSARITHVCPNTVMDSHIVVHSGRQVQVNV